MALNIVFVIPTLGHGGAEKVVTLLANEFVKKDKVSIVCLEKGNTKEYNVNNKVTVYRSDFMPRRGSKRKAICSFINSFTKLYKETLHLLKLIQPDVVISFLPKADIVVYLCRKIYYFKWISSERNDQWIRSFVERAILNQIYRKTDVLVCQTVPVSTYYKKHSINTVVIHNPISFNKNEAKDHSHKKSNGSYCIAVGKLCKQKNFNQLIDAVALVESELPKNLFFVILGDGPEYKTLMEKIEKLNLSKRVFLLGRKENVYEYLRNAEFFVMSSKYEGTPNALLEAMNAKLPVISTDFKTGSAKELVNEKNGMLVRCNDIAALSEALICMSKLTKHEKMMMGEQSYKLLLEYEGTNVYSLWRNVIGR